MSRRGSLERSELCLNGCERRCGCFELLLCVRQFTSRCVELGGSRVKVCECLLVGFLGSRKAGAKVLLLALKPLRRKLEFHRYNCRRVKRSTYAVIRPCISVAWAVRASSLEKSSRLCCSIISAILRFHQPHSSKRPLFSRLTLLSPSPEVDFRASICAWSSSMLLECLESDQPD